MELVSMTVIMARQSGADDTVIAVAVAAEVKTGLD
jgi:hypothetical protein